MDKTETTIAAISTPIGEGGIGVIRLSGPLALRVADDVFESRSGLKPGDQKSFTAQLGWIVAKNGTGVESLEGVRIDEAVVLVMRAPKSYTREDMVEISCHGAQAVLRKVLSSVSSVARFWPSRGSSRNALS